MFSDGLHGLVGDDCPVGWGCDGDPHGRLEVGLIKARKDSMGCIWFEASVDVLVGAVKEGHAAYAVPIIFVDVGDGHSVSPFLQVQPRDRDKVLGGRGEYLERVDHHLLNLVALEVDLEIREVSVFKVEIDFCEAVVLGCGEYEVKLVADATRSYES